MSFEKIVLTDNKERTLLCFYVHQSFDSVHLALVEGCSHSVKLLTKSVFVRFKLRFYQFE